jgi:hypothetical protein
MESLQKLIDIAIKFIDGQLLDRTQFQQNIGADATHCVPDLDSDCIERRRAYIYIILYSNGPKIQKHYINGYTFDGNP